MTDHPAIGFGPAFSRSQRPRRRPALHRDAIVDAAVGILDREGTSGLTIRRLATEVGAGAASIYWHVDDREALMDLALDRVLDPVVLLQGLPPSPASRAADGATDALRAIAVAFYEVLIRHRWAAQHMVASQAFGPNFLAVWEYATATLLDRLTDDDVFQATSAVLSYVLGVAGRDAAWAAGTAQDHDGRAQEASEFLAALDPGAYPALRRMGSIFAGHDQREQFLTGLEMLLAGIRKRCTRPSSGPGGRAPASSRD